MKKHSRKTRQERTSLDQWLTAMPLHDRKHFLTHNRTVADSHLRDIVREWRNVMELSKELTVPPERWNSIKTLTADFAAGAFMAWNPNFFDRLAAEMRLVADGRAHAPATVEDYKIGLRRYVLQAATPRTWKLRSRKHTPKRLDLVYETTKPKPINCLQLACKYEGIAELKSATDAEQRRVENTRKNILNICRRHSIPTLPRGWPAR